MNYDPRFLPAPTPWPRRIALAMPIAAAILLLLAGTLLSGCASVIDGTSQVITVATDPPAATCSAFRQGAPLFQTSAGHSRAIVSKSRHAIDLTCTAPGFEDTSVAVNSSISAMGVASMATFDFGITDYATGALNKYPDSVTVTLKPKAP